MLFLAGLLTGAMLCAIVASLLWMYLLSGALRGTVNLLR